MKITFRPILLSLAVLLCVNSQAGAVGKDLTCYLKDGCVGYGVGLHTSSNPSTGNQIKINPSAVPTEKGFGIEAIFYGSDVDLSLVRGTGRVGAAISPSNNEETFFGPPGYEIPDDLLKRKINSEKYPKQKLTLATAFDVFEKKGSGLGSYSLKLGIMGRYNQLTHGLNAGGGMNGTLGPLTFGGSLYSDETQLDYSKTYGSTYSALEKPVFRYQVQAYNVGLFLNSVILDYSNLRVQASDPSTVHLYTVTVFYGRTILTAAKRIEESSRPNFDFNERTLVVEKSKEEMFGGLQYNLTNALMVGALYNYYLMREFSGSVTLFF